VLAHGVAKLTLADFQLFVANELPATNEVRSAFGNESAVEDAALVLSR
jgi:hypothetical protein